MSSYEKALDKLYHQSAGHIAKSLESQNTNPDAVSLRDVYLKMGKKISQFIAQTWIDLRDTNSPGHSKAKENLKTLTQGSSKEIRELLETQNGIPLSLLDEELVVIPNWNSFFGEVKEAPGPKGGFVYLELPIPPCPPENVLPTEELKAWVNNKNGLDQPSKDTKDYFPQHHYIPLSSGG